MAETNSPRRPPKARVFVLYTGGTIGMVPKDGRPGNPLVPGSIEQIEQAVDRLLPSDLGIQCTVAGPLRDGPLDSSDVSAAHWKEIAHLVRDAYDQFDGFVILHGTDTMAYTSSVLSFMLENLGKPVVITGSQLPLSNPRTDARLNLVNSIYIAGYKATGLPRLSEVALCFGESLLRGCRARKDTTSDINGFDSPNFPPLGRLGEYISIDRRLLRRAPSARQRFAVFDDLLEDVALLDIFPTMTPELLRQMIAPEKKIPRVIIIRTFGAGNMQSERLHPGLIEVIREATARGKAIINVTQCRRGMVQQGLYEASAHLAEVGAISGADMTPEAALAKAFVVGGRTSGPGFAQQVLRDLVGEQSVTNHVVQFRQEAARHAASCRFQGDMPGTMDGDDLFEAVLVVSGVDTGGAPTRLRVFASAPGADPDTPESDGHFVAAKDLDGSSHRIAFPIKERFEQLFKAGGVLDLTLVNTNRAELAVRDVQLSVIERTVSL